MGASDHVGSLMTARIFSALVPFLCGVLGVILTNMPLSLGGGLVPAPLLGLIPIYFWCLMRPDLMTPAVTFAIGILQDILGGGPPGIWTLGFVLAYAVVSRQRDVFAGLSGPGAVLGFATAALITCGAAARGAASAPGRNAAGRLGADRSRQTPGSQRRSAGWK